MNEVQPNVLGQFTHLIKWNHQWLGEVIPLDFKVYRIKEQMDYSEEKGILFKKYFKHSKFEEDKEALKFLITNDVDFQNGIIVGTICQEYTPNSFYIREDKSIGIINDIEPYERTFFAYDFYTKALLVQNRRFSPKNLTLPKTFDRLKRFFNKGYKTTFNLTFTPEPVVLEAHNELFIDLFKSHRVVEIIVSDINKGRILPKDTKLLMNREENERLQALWNNDTSLLDTVHLKTTSDGDLNKSPYALAVINAPGGKVQKIKYFDSTEDKIVTDDRSKLDKFSIPNIDLNTESVTAFNEILKAVNDKRNMLRNMIYKKNKSQPSNEENLEKVTI